MRREVSRFRTHPNEVEQVARQQFVTELVARAHQNELDQQYRQRWEKRRPDVHAQERRERRVLWSVFAACLALAIVLTAALVFVLLSFGLPILAALVLAAVLGGGSSAGCCAVTVTVIHR